MRCHTCNRTLVVGESAWADDWKVIDATGTTATLRVETRYTCDDCAPDPASARTLRAVVLADAIRLTVEYVGEDTLPPIEGWSWFDALTKHRPDMVPIAACNPPAQQQQPGGRDD